MCAQRTGFLGEQSCDSAQQSTQANGAEENAKEFANCSEEGLHVKRVSIP